VTPVVTLTTQFWDMETNTINSQWTDESIIDVVRKVRNDLIKDFLDERFLKEYVLTQFNVRELSNVRIELIKKELKELLISPVNTKHYESLISHIRLTDSASLTENNERLFYKEMEAHIKRFIY
jgi:hypothetical protein